MPEIRVANSKAVSEKLPDLLTELHPAWSAMIQFCRDLQYGEIACIKIHDGVPVSAEVVTQKIRWS
jgi:hypothetical protein